MSYFKAEYQRLKMLAESLAEIQSKLKGISGSIDSKAALAGSSSAADEINRVLKIVRTDLENDTLSVKKMSSVLRSISTQYLTTEKMIMMQRVLSAEVAEAIAAVQAITAAAINSIGRIIGGLRNGNGAYDADPVDMTSGNYIDAVRELTIHGPCGLNMTRFYNSVIRGYGDMGTGWSHNYEISIDPGDEELIVNWGDQSKELFTACDEGVFISAAGSYETIIRTDEGFLYKTSGAGVWEFDLSGELERHNGGPGHGTLEFTHEYGRLTRVCDSYQNYLEYEYSAEGLLTSVTDHTGRKVIFAYENGCLTEALAADGLKTCYTYDDRGLLAGMTGPDGAVKLTNEYDIDNRVVKQTLADGSVSEIEYSGSEVRLKDRNGAETVYVHDEKNRITEARYPAGTERFEYNEKNERIRYIDPEGNVFRRRFDDRGNIVEYTDALGNTSSFTYDDDNNLIRSEAPDCGVVTSEYDENGNVISETDSLGNVTRYEYESGFLTGVINPDGSKVSYAYDDKGRLASACNETGNTDKYEYDEAGRLSASENALGARFTYVYDAADRLLCVTNPNGDIRSYTYENGLLASVTDYDGYKESWKYNAMGLTSEHTDKQGRITRFAYDSMGNISEVTNPDGSVLRHRYDDMNRLAETTGPEGTYLCIGYDANGNCIRREENGHISSFRYDGLGRVILTTSSDGKACGYKYDGAGRITSIVHNDGREYMYSYDTAGRRTGYSNSAGRSYTYKYDSMGRLVFRSDYEADSVNYSYYPDGLLKSVLYSSGASTVNTYDAAGRLISEKKTSGYELVHEYDLLGRRICTRDNEGRSKSKEYDASGNVISRTDPLGNTTRYAYSPSGMIVYVKDALGNETRYGYDPMDRQVLTLKGNMSDKEASAVMADPAKYQNPGNKNVRLTRWKRDLCGRIIERVDAYGNTEKWSYDADHQLNASIDADGRSTLYKYSDNRMLESVEYHDNNQAAFYRDDFGRITGIDDWTGKTSAEYDAYGRILSMTNGRGDTMRYTYEPSGRLSEMVYPDGTKLDYRYGSNGLVEGITAGGFAAAYVYDAAGLPAERRIKIGSGNGPGRVLDETFGYTAAGKLRSMTQKDGGSLICDLSLDYDDAGNLTRRTQKSGRSGIPDEDLCYEYDALNRLCRVYSADGAGGREVIESYEYDRFGNCMLSYRNGVRYEYRYDLLDRLVEESTFGPEGRTRKEYHYDKEGHLIRTEGAEQTERVYDARGNLEMIRNSAGKTVFMTNSLGHLLSEKGSKGERRFCSDQGLAGTVITAIEEDGSWKNYIRDGRVSGYVEHGEGSICLTDEKGSVVSVIGADDSVPGGGMVRYDSYGKASGDGDPDFGYTGLYRSRSTGTLFTMTREYDPAAGRFVSRDRDLYMRNHRPETLNLYQYCYSNPLIWVDPEGTDCYIFYLPEWKHEAVNDQRQLAKQYGYDTSKVHLIPVTDNDSFTSGWNGMGREGGHSVDIDTVLINSHGSPFGLGDNKSFDLSTSDIGNLDSKDAENMILLGCNSGNLDYADSNPAAEFARKVNGAPVLASDSTVQSGGTLFNLTKRSYSSVESDSFRTYSGDRDNQGWIVYQERNGQVGTTALHDDKMHVTDMVKNLRNYPKANGRSFTGGGGGHGW